MKFIHKENLKPKIKPMIENLENELYQLENKKAKDVKFRLNMRQKLEEEKGYKTFFRVLKRQNMQIQIIFQY